MKSDITIDDIEAAGRRIAAHIQPLRITPSDSLSKRFGCDILLAHEYLQTTGAFKLRGAMNTVLQLPPGASGVTAVSTGNHGRALAYSARLTGVPCIICMSKLRLDPNRGLAIGPSATWDECDETVGDYRSTTPSSRAFLLSQSGMHRLRSRKKAGL